MERRLRIAIDSVRLWFCRFDGIRDSCSTGDDDGTRAALQFDALWANRSSGGNVAVGSVASIVDRGNQLVLC